MGTAQTPWSEALLVALGLVDLGQDVLPALPHHLENRAAC